MFSVISILISTASSLQPEISNVDCTEEIATIDWINHYHDDLNTIWGYCVHHYCNTVDDVIINETVSMSCMQHENLVGFIHLLTILAIPEFRKFCIKFSP